MEEQMSDILINHWLRWLVHVARMDDEPKQMLFGELFPNDLAMV